MRSSFKLGRIGGIEIGVHYTWLLAFLLVAWSLAEGFFPVNYPGWGSGVYWATGVVAALLLFISVLVHELSHSFVALARGQGVHSITLFIFGGVSNIKGEARRPIDEFLVSIAGPATSFILSGLFWALGNALRPGADPVGAVVEYLAFINLLLGFFNLLPGFPLDGGRVLRSIVWAASGSLRRATRVASYAGQALGLGLVLWGLYEVLGGQILSGLWTAFIGWFLNGAAESSRHEQAVQEDLAGIRVAQVMDPDPHSGPPTTSVAEFVFDRVLRRGQRAMLVTDGTRLLGIVTITDARELPQERWLDTPVERIMTPVPLRSTTVDAPLSTALEVLVDGSLNQMPVVRDGQVVGLLTRAGILRYMQLRDELHLRQPAREAGRPASLASES